MKASHYIDLIALGCCLLLASCGNIKRVSTGELPDSSPSSVLLLNGLELLDGSILDETSSRGISVSWEENEEGLLATVTAEQVQGLKALYLALDHDAALEAGGIQPGTWATGNSLQLAVTPEAGHSEAGIVLIDPDNTAGFSGSGVLAQISFRPVEPALARTGSMAPLNQNNKIDFSYDPASGLCYWFYQNQGDYDQNGVVNISDLTPLAIHFGKTAAGTGFDYSSVESAVDGDGNGAINISDISPIGVNFGNSIDSFNIYVGGMSSYPASPSEPSALPEFLNVPLVDANGDKSKNRLFFTASGPGPLPSSLGLWLRPASGSSEGIPSDTSGFGNQSPVAAVNLSDPAGLAPLSGSADASSSSDPDGDPLTYHWILDDLAQFYTGAGIFNPTDMGSTLPYDLPDPGEYLLFLIVRDPHGGLDFLTENLVVTANAGWQIVDLNMDEYHTNLVSFQDVDLADVTGKPSIAYSFDTGGGAQVYMAQADNLFEEDWDVTDLVHAQSGVDGSEVAIAEIAGTAAAAAVYSKPGGGEAVYARQIEPDGYDLYAKKLFETPPGALSGIDMASINNQAMLAYRNVATGELRFCVAVDETAQNWLGPVSLGITGAPSTQICLQEVNGAPAFAYWAGPSSNRLRYHSSVMNGPIPVFSSGTTLSVLTSCSLQDALVVLDDGSPAVIFNIPTNTALYQLRAVDPQASMWENDGEVTPQNVALTEYTAGIHAGRPAVLWYDVLEAKLYYQRAENAEGTSWGASELVDDALAIGVRPTMAEIRGIPAIAYIDQGRTKIRYGIRVE